MRPSSISSTTWRPSPPCRAVVDLNAISSNYRYINSISNDAECAAVLKADAYGIGITRVAPELYSAGARTFFVAYLTEALELRSALGNQNDSKIYVLEGNVAGTESVFLHNEIAPVLNSMEQVNRWKTHQRRYPGSASCAIHIDTGMNRYGISITEANTVLSDAVDYGVDLVMSHLSSADNPNDSQNELQLNKLLSLKRNTREIRYSIANSSGVFLGEAYHLDLVRTGAALFGIQPTDLNSNPLRQVIKLEARLCQIRYIESGSPVGYGSTFISDKPMCLGTLSIGYADGYPRSLSGSSVSAVFMGQRAPLIGRVSMDSIVVDLSSFRKNKPEVGDYLELISETLSLDEMANNAGTIGYEILTGIRGRVNWEYQSFA